MCTYYIYLMYIPGKHYFMRGVSYDTYGSKLINFVPPFKIYVVILTSFYTTR